MLQRIASDEGLDIEVEIRSAEGGSGQALNALKQYGIDLAHGTDSFLDVLVVAIDGNCNGPNDRRKQVEHALRDRYPGQLVIAVPDPHVELWYLADRRAIARVLDEDFAAAVPAQKCERGRYKKALREACRRAGVDPVAGGAEYGEDVAAIMDLDAACRNDAALKKFLQELRGSFRVVG